MLTSMSQAGEETLTSESLLAMFEEQTGLDLGNFSDLLLFGDLTPENGLSLVGRGEMDIDQLFEQLQEEASGSLTESKYRDARLIEGTKAGGEFALGVISDEVVILGMPHQVRAAIDVSAGEREGLSADLLDAYDSLGAPLVKGVIAIEAGRCRQPDRWWRAVRRPRIPGCSELGGFRFRCRRFRRAHLGIARLRRCAIRGRSQRFRGRAGWIGSTIRRSRGRGFPCGGSRDRSAGIERCHYRKPDGRGVALRAGRGHRS